MKSHRINFRLLGVQNIRVVNSPAEAFLEQLRGQTQTTPDRSSGTIDLIYIDPARRDDQGKKYGCWKTALRMRRP
ncbi:MAG: hypothetical protein ACLR1G_06105 [Alistipes indistinctus]